jgi:hypothetical protein
LLVLMLSSVVLLNQAPVIQPPGHVQYAMAAGLLVAAKQGRYEPPTEQEVKPVNPQPPKAEAMPAPVMTPRMPQREPAAGTADIKPEALPAPFPADRLAQADSSQEEILKCLERLEEESRRLRQQLPQNQPTTAPVQSGGPSPQRLPAQMVPGWRVSLYEWNAEGNTSRDPIKVFQVRNQRFTARLGQREIHRGDRSVPRLERRAGHTNEMFVYKLEGWLSVTRPGQYQIAQEVNCGFDHPCSLIMKIGDQQIFAERNRNYDNKLIYQGRELAAGAYKVEVLFNIKSNFMKFDPERVSIYPQIRGPGEHNFRDFQPNELVSESDPSIPTGLPR